MAVGLRVGKLFVSADAEPAQSAVRSGTTALVLGGGGALGAAEVGMLRAVAEHGIRPDLVLGCSVGALNGAFFAADPTVAGVDRLKQIWISLERHQVFGESVFGRLTTLIRHGTYLHANAPLRLLIERGLPGLRIEELPVRFECVAASVERAAAHWFDRGPLVDAVLASCAVPGLLPPVEINGEHFLDGGLVYSVPVGPAVGRGATRLFVMQVRRLEQPLTPPSRPWEVGLVAFEIARRHRFNEDLASLPPEVEIHVLPGASEVPPFNFRYRRDDDTQKRIEAAYEASAQYLARVPASP
jgi:NTE family protein